MNVEKDRKGEKATTCTWIYLTKLNVVLILNVDPYTTSLFKEINKTCKI